MLLLLGLKVMMVSEADMTASSGGSQDLTISTTDRVEGKVPMEMDGDRYDGKYKKFLA